MAQSSAGVGGPQINSTFLRSMGSSGTQQYRVSTARQGRSGRGLEAQKEAVRSHLNGGNWNLVAEVVEIESGKRSDRPKLAEALRFCRLHNATLRPKHGRGKPLPLVSDDDGLDVLTVLERAIAADTAKRTLRNLDVIRLAKVEVLPDQGLLALLFRRSDPDATPQMYEHRQTLALRKSDKTDDDAVTVSAHLFVSLQTNDEGGHTAALEEVQSIGRTYVMQILLDALRDVTYESADKRGKPIESQTLVDVSGIRSDRLADAAGESRLEFIELVRPAETDGLDTEGLAPREQRMIVRIEPDAADPVALVRRVKEWALGRDWRKVKVKINLPEDKSRLVDVSRETDAADILFVRARKVDLVHPMDACTETVNVELATKARAVISEQE